MTTTTLTAAPGTAKNLPTPVTHAHGEPGADCFAGWLATQPQDAELTHLAASVQAVEIDFMNARSAVPRFIAARIAAEDDGDGASYSNAVAQLAGLPRLLGKLGSLRVSANLAYLARLARVAERAATTAETALPEVRDDVRDARRDLHTRHDSGKTPNEGAMTPGEVYQANTMIEGGIRKLAASSEAAERAREVAVFARIRARFYDPAGEGSRLDLALPMTWNSAAEAHGATAKTNAERQIKTNG